MNDFLNLFYGLFIFLKASTGTATTFMGNLSNVGMTLVNASFGMGSSFYGVKRQSRVHTKYQKLNTQKSLVTLLIYLIMCECM